MNWFRKTRSKNKVYAFLSRAFCILFTSLLLAIPKLSFAANEDDVSRLDFIQLMVKNQSQSKMLPENASSLSDEELFKKVTRKLEESGFNVLSNKKPDQPLSQQEFVRLTYAFAGQPSGKSLFEQKLYLKEAGIIESADVGLTTGLQGRVAQFREQSEALNASELAGPVFMNDRVETDFDSMVTFTFDDGSTLSLGEDAVVNITEHIYDPDRDFRKTIVNVAMGAVRFKVTKGKAEGSMFQVQTPIATAGVRGTEFVTMVTPDGKTRFVGLEGKIETFARLPNGEEGKHEFVVAGTQNEIAADGVSSGVMPATQEILQNVLQQTNPQNKISSHPKVTLAKALKAVNINQNSGKTQKAQKIKNPAADQGMKAVAVDTARQATRFAAVADIFQETEGEVPVPVKQKTVQLPPVEPPIVVKPKKPVLDITPIVIPREPGPDRTPIVRPEEPGPDITPIVRPEEPGPDITPIVRPEEPGPDRTPVIKPKNPGVVPPIPVIIKPIHRGRHGHHQNQRPRIKKYHFKKHEIQDLGHRGPEDLKNIKFPGHNHWVGIKKPRLRLGEKNLPKDISKKIKTNKTKFPLRRFIKKTSKRVARKAAKEAAKGATKSVAKRLAKYDAKNITKFAAQRAARKAARGTAKSAAKKLVKKVANDTAKSVARKAAKSTAKGAAKSVAKKVAKRVAKVAAKSAARKAAKRAAKKAAKSVAKKVAKRTAKGTAKSVAKKAAKRVAKVAAKSAARKAAKRAAKKAAKSVAKKVAKRVAKATAKSVAKKTTKRAAKIAANSAAKRAAQIAAKRAAKKAARKAARKAAKQKRERKRQNRG